MRRAAPALLALALIAAGCGGGGGGGGPAAATSTGGTVTNAQGATCSGRAPSPPAQTQTYDAPPPLTIDRAKTYTATLQTSCGDIVVRLTPARAPVTVNNFVFLARKGFYDGLTFHRVIPGYVIQGGAPPGNPDGGPGYTFKDELPIDGYPPGAVAMANAGPGTNGSQFFIVVGDASALPNAYSKFGRVVRGLAVARRIADFADPSAAAGDPNAGTPSAPIWIYRVTIAES